MTIYYVDSAATGAANGTSWTDAWTTLGAAITAVTTAGDVIYISHAHNEQLTADTVYTIGANHVQSNPLKIYSVNKSNSALTAGAFIGHSSSNRSITFAGDATGLYLYGLTLQKSGVGGTDNLNFYSTSGGTARSVLIVENCNLYVGSNISDRIRIGSTSTNGLTCLQATFLNCEFRFGNTSNYMYMGSSICEFINCTMSGGATYPDVLMGAYNGGAKVSLIGCDVSNNSTIFKEVNYGQLTGVLQQCKLKSGFILIDNSMTAASIQATLLDCDSGDVHYRIGHADYFGELQVDTGIYCNDAITDTPLSWKIISSSTASMVSPYKTPWITVYHSGTLAITPYLEILRSGSSTAFTDAEVWAEYSYKGTSGYTIATVGNDRCAPLGTPVNQASSSKGASDWMGENATSWFGKIGPSSSIAPAESGDIAFRICVGVASTTVYVDPQIRGLT